MVLISAKIWAAAIQSVERNIFKSKYIAVNRYCPFELDEMLPTWYIPRHFSLFLKYSIHEFGGIQFAVHTQLNNKKSLIHLVQREVDFSSFLTSSYNGTTRKSTNKQINYNDTIYHKFERLTSKS